MSDLDRQFREATERYRHLRNVSGDVMLEAYALFKQVTEGDVTGERPGFNEFAERAKYDARAKLAGIDPDEARKRYIELVDHILETD